ncbi:hypothetical protein MF271_09500 [Deinococcus sp. KNUC1210]|uniref:hypothetical protein n=1 Tax=Deinococcus sp. KNUC1210 TaxID=2917691 RepID=UPI001EF03224|nr:hypothetical protein [Deinococcus sp. KNUC1210]ULH16777.1 hypothetical protein MF271_09500 [Deinococcus sp. KNUC1210]
MATWTAPPPAMDRESNVFLGSGERDTETKLLLGCPDTDFDTLQMFLSGHSSFGCLILPRPTRPQGD